MVEKHADRFFGTPFVFKYSNLRFSFRLLTLDTQASENQRIIFQIKEEAQYNKMFEAFAEAAPQFILQISILLQTGVQGKLENDLENGLASVKAQVHLSNLIFLLSWTQFLEENRPLLLIPFDFSDSFT